MNNQRHLTFSSMRGESCCHGFSINGMHEHCQHHSVNKNIPTNQKKSGTMERSEIKSIFKRLESMWGNLSPYQQEFVRGLKKYHARNNKLSAKQVDALININNSVMVAK